MFRDINSFIRLHASFIPLLLPLAAYADGSDCIAFDPDPGDPSATIVEWVAVTEPSAVEVEVWLPDSEEMLVDVEFLCGFDGVSEGWSVGTVAAEPLDVLALPVSVPEACRWNPEQDERAGTLSVAISIHAGGTSIFEEESEPLRLSFPGGLVEEPLLESQASYLASDPEDERTPDASELPELPESSVSAGPVYTDEVE